MLKDLFLLDPRVIFLNHGSFGACPRPVFEAYQEWQRKLECQPVQFLGVDYDHLMHQAREKLAQYLHTSAENIVYIPNATHGVNIVARSLLFMPGDEILATDQEYGACNYIWEFISAKTNSRYKIQPISFNFTSPAQIVDQFWQAVSPRTKLIFISHITSPTALTLPIQLICQKARQAGIFTLIDGAHAPGQIPLDLDALQADFYVGNCHKWMLSPKGAGFIFARPEVQALVEPLVVSWGYQSRSNPARESRFVDYLQWSGTKDPAAALAVPSAIEFMEEHNWDVIRADCHTILKQAMDRISELTRLTPLYPSDSSFYQQMATIPLPRVKDLNQLKDRLYTEYKIELPCMEWRNQHYIRISVQAYNSMQDIESLVKALEQLLPSMQIK